MQKISLFYLFTFQIQLILESHYMTGHTHTFDHANPLNFQSPFNLHEFVPVGSFLR